MDRRAHQKDGRGMFLPWEDAEARRDLEAEFSHHPHWAATANRVGLLRLLSGDRTGAADAFDAALAENPRYAWAALNLATARALDGPEGNRWSRLAGQPDPAPGARALTEVWLAVGHRDWTTARRLRDRFPGFMHGRWDTRSASRAIAARRATLLLPGLHELWRWASANQIARGLPGLARHSARRMACHWADPATVLNHRAHLAVLGGDDEGAARAWELALRAAPHDSAAPAALARRAIRGGDADRARALLTVAIRRSPGFPDLHVDLGVLESRLGNDEAALRCYRRALAINPLYRRARREEAGALARLGRVHEASLVFGAFPAAASPGNGARLPAGAAATIAVHPGRE